MDLIAKRLADEENERAGNNDLKSLKMDDTTFEFNTTTKQSAGVLSDLDFDSIKVKLNLYRKLPGFCSCATTEWKIYSINLCTTIMQLPYYRKNINIIENSFWFGWQNLFFLYNINIIW